MNVPILQTKLYVPQPQASLIARPRLMARLDEGLRARSALTLVSAPAGYGKTTLIAAWLQQRQQDKSKGSSLRCAWLSLDEDDNTPIRFFTHLLASIKATGLTLHSAEQALLSLSSATTDSGTLVTALLNGLSCGDCVTSNCPLVVVLDDYHRIQTAAIHESLQFWLDHAPPFLHLILVTREDPPLMLARWRVSNQLTEVRVNDLRFTCAETAAFLNESMGLSLTADDVAALEAHTEGWVAGLQLAAVALRASVPGTGTIDPSAFITAFSGSHYYVIDYLLEEVLRQQEQPVCDFLRKTAILDTFNAALCDAVTAGNNSQPLLTYLERHNLFLIPLDNRRHWYRYHHLIADSLQTLLDDNEQVLLHQRAAHWYERNGFAAKAVRHALATGDLKLAFTVMERVIQQASTWSQGDVAQISGWLDALPEALLRAHPTLSLHASRALYLAGDLTAAHRLVQQAQASLQAGSVAQGERDRLQPLATVYQAAISALRGENLAAAIVAIEQLPETLVANDTHTAARAADTLGLAYELCGDLVAAERAYLQASDLARRANVHYLTVNGLCEAALVQIQLGHLTEAAESCHAALHGAETEPIPPMGLAWTVLGEIARERNELTAAAEYLDRGIKLGQRAGITDDLRHAFFFLARLQQAQGNVAAALDAWQQGDLLLRRYQVPRLASLSGALRARLDLAQGNVTLACSWLERYQAQQSMSGVDALQEMEELTSVRILLRTDRLTTALERVQMVLAAARRGGRLRTVMEGLLLQALILQAQQQPVEAVASLSETLLLAAPAGFVRLFLDEGPGVATLLPRVRAIAPAFVDELAAAFARETGTKPKVDNVISPSTPSLGEPLSEREEEVLRLLASGCSNLAIAKALVITVGTAKWHLHNIYQKLGVSSRTEAVAHVRTSNLIAP